MNLVTSTETHRLKASEELDRWIAALTLACSERNRQLGMVVGSLNVTVVAARGLAGHRAGSSNPFVEVTVNGASFKTDVVKRNLDPEWGHSFSCKVDNVADPRGVFVQVWDQHHSLGLRAKDCFLGQVRVRLPPQSAVGDDCPEHGIWHTLHRRTKDEKVSGQVCLLLGWDRVGPTPQASLVRVGSFELSRLEVDVPDPVKQRASPAPALTPSIASKLWLDLQPPRLSSL
eukprot:CAMPEP_0114573746 /NCGR_PEP_ID=MMETSP0114-20121206/19030_1 /TAXON_ID=31324 /ORGANISM="Goniomonas sp, Strain m" /LENGTH=229 /DNA_ID=CAMNT_0001761125 /DNA_START=218 /DNA_END=903 /DNA_ORIENTATION=-